MFERLLRPIDNVYSATGGAKIYPKNSEKAIKFLSEIRDGKPLEKWLQNNWMPIYHTDPAGVISYEWLDEKCYPTYKSITTIRNYEADGQQIKWILYESKNVGNEKFWRFIDEEKDWLIKEESQQYSVVTDKTFPNPFGKVPGFVISDIIKIGSKERLSPIHSIIELAKDFLRDQSQKSMFKFLLWSPIFWRYAMKCQKCQGTGKTGEIDCPDCVDGFYVSKDITDQVTLPVPDDKEIQKLAPDIAGFIHPSPEILEEFTKELTLLYNTMFETIWGVQDKTVVQKTATEVYQDLQPEITKLNVYSDEAEWVESFMTNLGLKFYIPTSKNQAVILYGRNFILESVSTLLERYETSKGKGDNTAILDRQLKEWVLSKYKNDPSTMNEELTRLKIEPFIHFTIEQVNDIWGADQAKVKMLFSEWWMDADKNKTIEVLKKEYDSYCEEVMSEEDEPEMEPELDEAGQPVMDEQGKPKMKVKQETPAK